MNTKTWDKELTDHELKLLNIQRVFNMRQALYEPIYYSISETRTDIKLYRALRDAQDSLDKIIEMIEAGE
jgi:hypothetical protein